MAKPSRKKAATKRTTAKRKPAAPKPVDVVTTAPEPEKPTEPQGAGPVDVVTAGGPAPEQVAETPAPEAAEQPTEASTKTTEDAPAPEAPEEVDPPADEPEAPAPAAPFARCTVGPVEARVGRVSLDAVLGLLSPDGLRRIEAEKSTASFESVRQRLLATDGRATPVFFEAGAAEGDAPSILHGYAEIAAAQDCGSDDVTVILIPAGGASEAQSHIVEMVRQQRVKEQTTDKDDDLFYRVHAE